MATSISGTNFSDDDGNGQRGTSLLVGDNPDVIIVLDQSGSTSSKFIGSEPIPDQNSDGLSDTILDSEIAAAKAFHSYLIEGGYGESNLGLISFSSDSKILFDGVANKKSDNIYDFNNSLSKIISEGSTSFDEPLKKVKELINRWESNEVNIIFVSDGYPNEGDGVEIASSIRESGHNLQSFGTGKGASKTALDNVDINGKSYVFYVPNELVQVLSGDLSEDVQRDEAVEYTETGIKGNTIFVDLNGDGKFSEGEPSAITDSEGNYELEADIDEGSYDIRSYNSTKGVLPGIAQVSITEDPAKSLSVNIGSQETTKMNPIILKRIKKYDNDKLITNKIIGKDIVRGTKNDDVLAAGRGRNILDGKAGKDEYVFNKSDVYGRKGRDIIVNFKSGEDSIILGPNQFKKMKRSPTFLSVDSKRSLREQAETNVDFLYLEPKGKFFYNQNESDPGFGEGGLFAKLSNNTQVSANDLHWSLF